MEIGLKSFGFIGIDPPSINRKRDSSIVLSFGDRFVLADKSRVMRNWKFLTFHFFNLAVELNTNV